MKVRSHLALTVVAAIVPLILFSAIGLTLLLNAERKAAMRGVQESVRATALLVDQELGNAEAAMRVLGTSQLLVTGDLAEFYRQAVASSRGEGTWTVLFDRSGQQLVNTLFPYGTPLPRRAHPENGEEIMRSRKSRVTGLVMGQVRKQLIVAMDVPVPVGGGYQYVMSQGFVPEYFDRVIRQQPVPPSWIIGLVDRNGITIARTRGTEQFVGKPTNPDIFNAMRNGREGVIRTTSLEGIDIYAFFAQSAMSGWTVAIGVPQEEIEMAARRAVWVAMLGLLVAVICAAIAATLFGRRLTLSIRDASRSAVALGRGKEPPHITSGVAEVDQLHDSLAEAGRLLKRERQSRQLAEAERTDLFVKEQEARKRADAQNKAKDEFLAMLGHELRNPLGAITSAAALMSVSGVTEQQIERARTIIVRQSRHLTHIVDDLLDLSRIMTGKILLQKQPVDIADTVFRCAEILMATDSKQHQWHIDAQSAWVDADPTRIEQIVNNLLVNAIKYTPSGGNIRIGLSSTGNDVVLEVHDTGIGIEPELLPNIFDVFVQGATSIDRAEGGMGIGLSLVRQLTHLHDGNIMAMSAGKEQGSTFTLRLPALASHDGKALPEAVQPVGAQRSVLLIEDNDDGRDMLAALLTLHGYRVQEARNGIDGLAIATSEPPDVAIVDIGLPGISGYEVAQRMRASSVTRHVRLIALTGYGLDEDRLRAAHAGFDVHLTKPYDETLLKALAHDGPLQFAGAP